MAIGPLHFEDARMQTCWAKPGNPNPENGYDQQANTMIRIIPKTPKKPLKRPDIQIPKPQHGNDKWGKKIRMKGPD